MVIDASRTRTVELATGTNCGKGVKKMKETANEVVMNCRPHDHSIDISLDNTLKMSTDPLFT